MDGQVPETTTYDEWIRDQDAETQAEVFGADRAKLLRAGKIDTRDMVTKTGKLRSLKDLERQ